MKLERLPHDYPLRRAEAPGPASERHVQGVAQESHEQAAGSERFGRGVDEIRLQDVLFAQLLQPGEIGSTCGSVGKIFQQGVQIQLAIQAERIITHEMKG
jgi:hypothetical protein